MCALRSDRTEPGERPSAERTLIHLVRHGKVHNPDGILYGRLPGYRLAASGRAMAAGVAHQLVSIDHADIGYLAASPLERAQETAEPLAELTGLPVATDARLTEAANSFQGRAFTPRSVADPAVWPKLRNPIRPSWGEPYLDIAHRMLGAVYAAAQAARGREAVLVSHQLPIWTIRAFLAGNRLWHNPNNRQCAVCSVTTLIFEDDIFAAVRYREPVAHIPAVDDPVQPVTNGRPGSQLTDRTHA